MAGYDFVPAQQVDSSRSLECFLLGGRTLQQVADLCGERLGCRWVRAGRAAKL